MKQAPAKKRFRILKSGKRVLLGLTVQETEEFDAIADLPRPAPYDEMVARSEDARWLELYLKHEAAWQACLASESKVKSKAAV